MPYLPKMTDQDVFGLIDDVEARDSYMGLLHGIIRIQRHTYERITEMATSTLAGLSALQQSYTDLNASVTNLTNAVTASLSEIQSLTNQLKNNPGTAEDATVQSLAAQIEQQVSAINQNVTGLTAAVPVPAAGTTVSGTPAGTDVHGTPITATPASPANPVPVSEPVSGTTGNDNPVPNAPATPAVNSAGGVS